MIRLAALALAVLPLLAACGGTTVQTGNDYGSTPLASVGIDTEGELAVAKLACRDYTPDVLNAQLLEYQVRSGFQPDYNQLRVTWRDAALHVNGLTAPTGSTLYTDLAAVGAALDQMSTKAVSGYRLRELGPAMRAFDMSDLSVSADCLALTTTTS